MKTKEAAFVASLLCSTSVYAQSNVTGQFGPVFYFPYTIPLHMVGLADGQVMAFGTDPNGNQTAQWSFEVWDPQINTHTLIQNTSANPPNDIFCSGPITLSSGLVLTIGGDLTVNGIRNAAQNSINIFNLWSNQLTAIMPKMMFPRWYPSAVAVPSPNGGDNVIAALGGSYGSGGPAVTTPELFTPNAQGTGSWQTLWGADNGDAYSLYPRAYEIPGGTIGVISYSGNIYNVDVTNGGSITQFPVSAPPGDNTLPAISYRPGKVLDIGYDTTLNQSTAATIIDFTTNPPTVASTDSIDQPRYWGKATTIVDGRVVVTGGTEIPFDTYGATYQATIWDPNTGHWTAGAIADPQQLSYHSNALLLLDGTLVVTEGGAPGPVEQPVPNMSARIYYPPYLFNADGSMAQRPNIYNPPTWVQLGSTPEGILTDDNISRIVMIRNGASTHSYDSDQRFIEVSFFQWEQWLVMTLPSDPTIMVPGVYMLFVINQQGTPSNGSLVWVSQ